MAVAMKEKESENERCREREEEDKGGGNGTAHAYCCLLLSHCCGGWWRTYICTHPHSDQLNNTKAKEEQRKKR